MKAGMFLAGLGSGAAQGYMMKKMMDKESKTPGEVKAPAPVRDAEIKPVNQNPAPEAPAPVDAPVDPANPAKKKVGTGVTQDDLVSEAEQYKKEWGMA